MPSSPSSASGLPAAWLAPFACLFTRPTWGRVPVLVEGALLAVHRRTVSAVLRATGQDRNPGLARYHRALNRARWSARAAARGIYRDPVRSSHRKAIPGRERPRSGCKGHFVKASGLRWVSLSLLAPIPWTGRIWSLPFLTVLASSERYAQERGTTHKKLTDWARQGLLQTARWLPGRRIVAVIDSGGAWPRAGAAGAVGGAGPARQCPAPLERRDSTPVGRVPARPGGAAQTPHRRVPEPASAWCLGTPTCVS